MRAFKGVGLISCRKLVEAAGPQAAAALQGRLSPAEQALVGALLPSSSYDIDAAARIIAATAQVCFPGEPQALRRVGAEMARDNLSGIYRVFLKIPSLSFVMSQTAALWSRYHDTGRAWLDEAAKGEHSAALLVEYPDMPRDFLAMLAGYLQAILELAGAKQALVQEAEAAGPQTWRFSASWR